MNAKPNHSLAAMVDAVRPLRSAADDLRAFAAPYAALEHLSRLELVHAVATLDGLDFGGARYGVKRPAALANNYARLWSCIERMIGELSLADWHEGRTGLATRQLPHEVAPERVKDLGKDLVRQCAHLEPHVELLRACFAKYPDVLIGKVDPVAVMFPRGSMQLIEGIFAGNPIVDHYNDIVARAIRAFVLSRPSDGQPLRIVEVGAGTGATSSRVLPALATLELPPEYVYTDISQRFIDHGKQAYGERYPFVRFQVLNLESDARFPEADVVLGTNVVHATRNIERTLRRMQGALRPGGVVVLNELMGRTDFSTLTFGLMPGWWLYEDDFRRIPGSPLLSLESWTAVLSEIGLSSNHALDPDGSPPPTYSRVIVASAKPDVGAGLRRAQPGSVQR